MADREVITSSYILLNLIIDTHDDEAVDGLVKIHGKASVDDLAWFVEEQGLSQDYLNILKEDFERTEHLLK